LTVDGVSCFIINNNHMGMRDGVAILKKYKARIDDNLKGGFF